VTAKKIYLTDGAYAEFDGQDLILTAENGIRVTDRVVLEPMAWELLVRFMERVKKEACT
jgi:hypothetical protein